MKLLKWSEKVQDRLEWKKIVEKAKTLHELQRLLRRRYTIYSDFTQENPRTCSR